MALRRRLVRFAADFLRQRELRGDGFGDDDGLGVEEFAHAGGGEFAAVAGALDAAEGQARVAGDHGVEEDARRTAARR